MYSDDDDDDEAEDGEKPKVIQKTQRILEKGRVNLQRSKSELGEQHKRMISHLSKSRNELRAQNKRVIASLSSGVERSRKRINRAITSNGSFKRNGGGGGNHNGGGGGDDDDELYFPRNNGFVNDGCGGTLKAAVNGNEELKENEVGNGDLRAFRGSSVMSASMTMATAATRPPPPPSARDLDSMLMDLGIEPISNGISNDIIVSSSSPKPRMPSPKLYRNHVSRESHFPGNGAPGKREPTALELRLEEGYGEEFEFMDGVATIKRNSAEFDFGGDCQTLKIREDGDDEGYNKTDSGFADEVFSELSRSSTFKRGSQQQQQQQQHYYRNHFEKPKQQQQRWSFKRRDSLSFLPTTDVVDDSESNGERAAAANGGACSPKLAGSASSSSRELHFPGNGMSSIEMSSQRRRQKRIRRLSAQSYTAGGGDGINNGSCAANLSYESIVNANYDESVVGGVSNKSILGSNHRLEGEEGRLKERVEETDCGGHSLPAGRGFF